MNKTFKILLDIVEHITRRFLNYNNVVAVRNTWIVTIQTIRTRNGLGTGPISCAGVVPVNFQ